MAEFRSSDGVVLPCSSAHSTNEAVEYPKTRIGFCLSDSTLIEDSLHPSQTAMRSGQSSSALQIDACGQSKNLSGVEWFRPVSRLEIDHRLPANMSAHPAKNLENTSSLC